MAVPKSILFFSGILSTFHFIETDIINFLINYKNICEDYNIEKKERVCRYSRYCVKYIAITIKGLAFFLSNPIKRD
jgi:hypothetical protein